MEREIEVQVYGELEVQVEGQLEGPGVRRNRGPGVGRGRGPGGGKDSRLGGGRDRGLAGGKDTGPSVWKAGGLGGVRDPHHEVQFVTVFVTGRDVVYREVAGGPTEVEDVHGRLEKREKSIL